MRHPIRRAGTSLIGVTLLLLSACATTLAPRYDLAIVDGLNAANTSLMTLFASTSSGTSKKTFEQRVGTYNNLIGSLDALAIQAKSRLIPKNKITEKVNTYLQKRGVQVLGSEDAPSATAMEAISKTITKMRDTDKKQGLTSFEVAAFKGQVVIYLDQAITYEDFLKR